MVERIIVARMRPIRSGVILAAILALVVAVYGIAWIAHDSDYFAYRKTELLFLVLLGGPFLLLVACAGFRQLFLHRGEMVWIEDRKVIYLDPRFSATPLNEIESIAPGATDHWPHNKAIILKSKTGEKVAIALWSLSESGDVILARLQDALKSHRSA